MIKPASFIVSSSEPLASLKRQVSTLCLVRRPGQLLLGLKKRGFGVGWWNGFGGKVQPGESVEAAAVRELQEEAGVTAHDATLRAELFFTFTDKPVELHVHVFQVTQFTGLLRESEEMKPQWFAEGDIPYDQMWADDRFWLPRFLAGEHLLGRFHFADNQTLLSHSLEARNKVAAAPASGNTTGR